MSNYNSSHSLPEKASRLNLLVYLFNHGPLTLAELFSNVPINLEHQNATKNRLLKMQSQKIISFEGDIIKCLTHPFETTFNGIPNGIGFVKSPLNGDGFVDKNKTQKAMNGDWVKCWIIGQEESGRPLIGIEAVLKRNPLPWIGIVEEKQNGYKLRSFDKKRPVLDLEEGEYKLQSNMVVGSILTEKKESYVLTCNQIIGDKLEAKMASEVTKLELGLPTDFSFEVKEEIRNLKNLLDGHYENRIDLRGLPFITIDGPSSRDFDDAVFAQLKNEGGFLLKVAIADVAAYVKPGTLLDSEAQQRGTSIYLPDQVIPMLPEELSNELCSLNPGMDRLCVVCSLNIDEKGKLQEFLFEKGIMRSHARLTYGEASLRMEALESKKEEKVHESSLVNSNLKALTLLQKILDIQNKNDFQRNKLEYRFKLNQDGEVRFSLNEDRSFSHRVIESCMIMANVAAARQLKEKQDGVFRVHNQPLAFKYEILMETLKSFDIQGPKWEDLNKESYLELLKTVGQHIESKRLIPLTQRLPSSAKYESNNGGHFSLGLDAYTHFTSPIRRYPDLLVHRALFDESITMDLDNLLDNCNEKEKRAALAERQVTDIWKAAWLEQHSKQSFKGIISGIRPSGIWVSLDNGIEGFLPTLKLPQNDGLYEFDSIRYELKNKTQCWVLGQDLDIHVKKISLGERKIEWGFGKIQPKLVNKKINSN